MEMKEDIRKQEQKEDRIEESEIRKTVKRIKMKKVAEIDGIPTEIEICRRRAMEQADSLNLIRCIGMISEDWGKSIVMLLYKKGDKEKTGN